MRYGVIGIEVASSSSARSDFHCSSAILRPRCCSDRFRHEVAVQLNGAPVAPRSRTHCIVQEARSMDSSCRSVEGTKGAGDVAVAVQSGGLTILGEKLDRFVDGRHQAKCGHEWNDVLGPRG